MSSIILTSSFRLFSLLLLASLLGICFCGSALWVESLAEFSGPTATKLFQYNLRPKERAIFINYFNQATIIFLCTIILLELYYSSSKIMVHRNTVFIREDAKLARNTHRYTYSTWNLTSLNLVILFAHVIVTWCYRGRNPQKLVPTRWWKLRIFSTISPK